MSDTPLPKPRTIPPVISLRLPPELRRRLQLAANNLPLVSRHAIAMTALSAGLDRVGSFADFAAAAVIEGQAPERKRRQRRD